MIAGSEMRDTEARYALYFAPERGSALARFGRRWLGYDAASGEFQPQPVLSALPPQRLAAITAEPRNYGFHATLKPPFALAAGTDARALFRAVADFADAQPAFSAPPLRLTNIGGFWALVPSRPCADLDALAVAAVDQLDAFRAPPPAAELAKRRRVGLTARQEALLRRWGYPYVMEEFRFHMTLTGRIGGDERAVVGEVLREMSAPLCRDSLHVDAVGLFQQPTRSSPFRMVGRFRLTGVARQAVG
jgi:putative phosphonate metabolism protein